MPCRVLSLDLPVKYEGGYALTDGHKIQLGSIIFSGNRGSERDDYRHLTTMISHLGPDLIILEWPFLQSLATVVGVVKGWCASHDIPWWMTGASPAKRLVLGRGDISKKAVLEWAHGYSQDHQIVLVGTQMTQHMADALLYLEAWRLT